jgi:16S rRNA (guanine527-N7)-methyltransferase
MTESNFVSELKKLGVSVNEIQLLQFKKYYELLIEWNEKINLTAITEKEEVYLKHFYDSATLVKVIDLNSQHSLCDIGTGAGFPGVVIKILFPNLKITLIDALEKRIKFLDIVIDKLGLKDIETIHARSEEYGVKNRNMYDVVTARAVASLPVLMEYSASMVKVEKYFIPMKANISQEIKNTVNVEKKLKLKMIKKEEFTLPYENSNRTIVVYQKEEATPLIFPRKNADIKKKPL